MQKNQYTFLGKALLPALILLTAAVIAAVLLGDFTEAPVAPAPAVPQTSSQPRSGQPSQSESTTPELEQETVPEPLINLGYGLEITDAGNYTGIYMEDGSDELVSDVMMLVVRNGGDTDLQMGQIRVSCGTEERCFTLTDLPAGAQAVLLEQERRPMPEETVFHAVLEAPVLFPSPMTLAEDRVRITGAEGVLNVENISETDISGGVYIYYKYASEDLLYGGITFRAHLQGGLKAGQLSQIPVGHYTPQGCRILRVEVYEADGV